MKLLQKIYKALDIPSGTGIGLLVFNAIGWCWYDVIKHGLNANVVGIVGVIFTGKTVHGIMTDETK